jgi:hypothetical protein
VRDSRRTSWCCSGRAASAAGSRAVPGSRGIPYPGNATTSDPMTGCMRRSVRARTSTESPSPGIATSGARLGVASTGRCSTAGGRAARVRTGRTRSSASGSGRSRTRCGRVPVGVGGFLPGSGALEADVVGAQDQAVSVRTAIMLLAECGADMSVFRTAAHLASWAGIRRATTSPAERAEPDGPATAQQRCGPRSPRPHTPPPAPKAPTSPHTTPTSAAAAASSKPSAPPATIYSSPTGTSCMTTSTTPISARTGFTADAPPSNAPDG